MAVSDALRVWSFSGMIRLNRPGRLDQRGLRIETSESLPYRSARATSV